MELALSLEKRSTCERKQVGTVITSSDFRYVYGIGYNGNASGLPNKCDFPDKEGGCGCLHSEDNCITNCSTARSQEKLVFITWSPCRMCAKRLINLGGVRKIYYYREYSDLSSLEMLNSVGITTEQLIP
jgi:deoxycytidylate deaminase